ncbi:hypothetical protein D7B24_005442 [Verticillium nonalfalfae]|uniref:Major facilitator superfamily (MFS) profile domain-containing protein n=1 Tax=Verticillium nonalfalfae TaxID=1051616 RepID=A0A3M9YEF5_9PEZI|nr:uncharacterized protein D7B24_005442 [Verticillium nonalfalfae]RNJ57958.1 hypothetical protein D7B24_005442 [Verticillium nonalfalfae]
MIVGRIVAYVYIGMELALVPVLQSELAPAEVRGFVVGTYQQGVMSQQASGTFLKALTGQNCGSIYGTTFIQSLGTVNPFAMSRVSTATGFFMVLVTQLISDKTGRVPLLVSGAVIQTGALLTMGGLGTIPDPSDSIKSGIVSVSILFGAGFCLVWAPLSHVVAAEIPTTALRDLTYAFGSVFNITIQFAVSFSIPYLLSPAYAGLGSKVGFIFGSTSFFAILFAWFCIPECGGKTLEEIDELFLRGVPVRKFRTAGTETRGADSERHGDGEGGGNDESITKEISVQ